MTNDHRAPFQSTAPGKLRQRLEQYIKNPHCQANALSAVHGISMDQLCRREGLDPHSGMSPFAFARGYHFENALLDNNGERLIDGLKKAEALPPAAQGFLDLRLKKNGGPIASLELANQLFEQMLIENHQFPAVIAAPTFQIPEKLSFTQGFLAADVLTITRSQGMRRLTIGEIKSYPDRGGYTDSEKIAGARAQAGLYIYALEQSLIKLGLKSKFEVSKKGFIVLSKPNLSPNYPRVRKDEDLRFQVQRAHSVFQSMRQLAGASQDLIHKSQEERVDALANSQIQFNDLCSRFCPRATLCRSKLLASDNPGALNDDIARLCGPISLSRSRELLEGAASVNQDERKFLEVVQELQNERAA